MLQKMLRENKNRWEKPADTRLTAGVGQYEKLWHFYNRIDICRIVDTG